MQNEAEVVLVLFLVTTFCEFGVKGAKTSVVVKKVVFFRLIFTIVRLMGIRGIAIYRFHEHIVSSCRSIVGKHHLKVV